MIEVEDYKARVQKGLCPAHGRKYVNIGPHEPKDVQVVVKIKVIGGVEGDADDW